MRAPAKVLRAHAFAALLLAACAAAPAGCAREVPVAVDPGLLESWTGLVAAHPLPRGYRRVAATGGTAAIRLERASTESEDAAAEAADTGATRLIGRVTLAAVAPFPSAPEGVTREEVASSPLVRLEPLELVSLPDLVLAVDGAYPGDDGYGLSEGILLSVDPQDRRLRRWLRGIQPLREPSPEISWVAAVGDLMLDRGADTLLISRGASALFRDTLPLLQSADFGIGNLESSVTRRGRPQAKSYTFRIDPRALWGLYSAGFRYLSVANNHSFDYGMDGFVDTIDNLRLAGMGTAGAGTNLAEALEPYIASVGASTLKIWSAAAYPAEGSGYDGRKNTTASEARAGVLWAEGAMLDLLRARISTTAGPDSLEIVAVHGGEEWSAVPTSTQIAVYRALAASGADVVIGSHPHVLQGMEVFGSSLIVYSLGNFLFPGMDGQPGGTDSVILLMGVHNSRLVSLRIVPVKLQGRTVGMAERSAARDRILALSASLARREE